MACARVSNRLEQASVAVATAAVAMQLEIDAVFVNVPVVRVFYHV
jgi:hypothetical protein